MVRLISKINLLLIPILISYFGYTLILGAKLNPDANYYLMIAREIINGHTPTYDLTCSYPPLAMYIYAAFMSIFSSEYIHIKLFTLLIHHLNCFLLYLIVNSNIKNRMLTVVICCVYYLFTLALDGLFIVLEPFQVFFTLIAVLFFLKYRDSFRGHILTGIFLGLALMCKQYSLTFIASFYIIFIYLNIKKKNNFSSVLINLLCFSVCIATPYLIFILFSKAQLLHSLEEFGFIGKVATSYARNIPISTRINLFFTLAGSYPVIFLPFLLYPFFRTRAKTNKSLYDLVFLLGLLAIIVLLVRQYKHYVQLVLPWSFILWSMYLNEFFKYKFFSIPLKNKMVQPLLLLTIVAIAVPVFPSSDIVRKKFSSFFPGVSKLRVKQQNEAKFVNTIFPPQTEVYIISGGCLYYDSQLFNPLRNYNFGHYKQILRPNNNFPFDHVQNFLIGCIRNKKTKKSLKRALIKKGYRQIKHPPGFKKSKLVFYTNNRPGI